ncbi:MAG: hypothetical protein KKG03_00640 [Gammaproteobacteria bacterium]|nr:hypothetical protein [Sideroxydans sp.]MBU3903166.1 hypothetical protein [Gammaproteobacteria bacterium]MBU4046372.1 hypothetical protein [Gammaproteobacteria bacterium]MBU4150138.1 hypothetical protein [Gammaproteobacteria bacterium]
MAGWLIPVIKSVLPHIGTIISAASPVFTRKSGDNATLQQQITELQSAASANDAHIKDLAAQMQVAIEALEKGTRLAEKGYRHAMLLGIASFILSLAALSIVLTN